MNLKELKDLIDLLKDTDIAELEIEEEGTKIKLKKKEAYEPKVQISEGFIQRQVTFQNQQEIPGIEVKSEISTSKAESVVEIKTPMVGTFYKSASLESSPFVSEGDSVEIGKVICIIEAMKLMNEIKAEFKCKIVKILVENGHAVEYGQPIFLVELL